MPSLSGGSRPAKHEVLDRSRVSSYPPVIHVHQCHHGALLASGSQGLQVHTTAAFTSTPLLLCEELMGYSATLVPFSSFLSGFLERMGWGGTDKDIVSSEQL